MPAPVDLLVILGPTASGKTRLAVAAARRVGGEIVSADSRQVFRGMDLGTGKDLAEYGEVPHHLIDILEPGEEFSLFAFQQRCYAAIAGIRGRGRLPILCGGTGLYLDAVLRRYRLVEVPENPPLRAELALLDDDALRERLRALRPEQHNSTDLLDRSRLVRAIEIAEGEPDAPEPPPPPELHPLVFGLRWERAELRRRIAARLEERLAQGMVQEVRRLHEERGISWERLDYYGLEYRYLARHLRGELSEEELVRQLAAAIGDFAKRQETFFRRMERQGVAIRWLDGAGEPLAEMMRIIASWEE